MTQFDITGSANDNHGADDMFPTYASRNLDACRALSEGREGDALRMLRQAIADLRTEIDSDVEISQTQITANASEPISSGQQIEYDGNNRHAEEIRNAHNREGAGSGRIVSMELPNFPQHCDLFSFGYFNRFLLLPTQGLSFQATVVVLLFNLGLILHRAGIQTGVSTSFVKAIRLYRQACSSLDTSPDIQYDSTGINLAMAALYCNMAQIQSEHVVNVEDARRLWRRLENAVYRWPGFVYVAPNDFSFFQALLFLAEITETAPAAAA